MRRWPRYTRCSMHSSGRWPGDICGRGGGSGLFRVIAGFSLVGIALGVATLIIVMSVMGGFQVDLLEPDT